LFVPFCGCVVSIGIGFETADDFVVRRVSVGSFCLRPREYAGRQKRTDRVYANIDKTCEDGLCSAYGYPRNRYAGSRRVCPRYSAGRRQSRLRKFCVSRSDLRFNLSLSQHHNLVYSGRPFTFCLKAQDKSPPDLPTLVPLCLKSSESRIPIPKPSTLPYVLYAQPNKKSREKPFFSVPYILQTQLGKGNFISVTELTMAFFDLSICHILSAGSHMAGSARRRTYVEEASSPPHAPRTGGSGVSSLRKRLLRASLF